ncbi:MAG: V-type ATP synthase subunit I [Acholeplasma sp.]|nr:V-type ATP synthase subunit I [Acholeplasma sp.]
MIKEVQKVKIIVPKDKKDALLLTLQKEETVMLTTLDDSSVDITYEEEIISRATNIIKKMSSHIKRNRKFFHYDVVKYDVFVNHFDERLTLLEEIESKFDELNFLQSENRDETKLIDDVKAYKSLKHTTKDLSNSRYVSFYFGYVPENRWEFFNSYCSRVGVDYVDCSYDDYGHHLVVYLDNDDVEVKHNQLKRFGFVERELPIIDIKIADYIEQKDKLIKNNNDKIKKIEKFLANASNEEYELKVLVDQMYAQIDRKRVVYKEDEKDVSFNGWISVEDAMELQAVVKNITLEYQLEFDAPSEFDDVPTLLKNNKFIEPFESITNTYSVPNYREIDPNPAMSFWYWLIFGIMMGDIGYGIIMMVGFGLFSKYKKPKGEFGQLVKVLAFSGLTATLAGFAFGSLFGVDLPYTPLINPSKDPMKMLIFSIGLGIIHLTSALVMKVRLAIKQKDYIDGVASGLSWIFILVGLALFALNLGLSLNTSALKTIALIVIIIGVVLLIVFSGLKKKGIFGKIFGGFGGLFGVTSYLSDILSYSRILALVLSSGIIASTMNMLAGLLQGNPISFVFSLLVYVAGHAFNFVMGLLSAYVHTGRLQYLEFYGKFFEGGGYLFAPLKFNTKYINEITK